jgi:hypothetical protein
MNTPFRHSKSMPERALTTLAAGAGLARLAIKQRTLRPHPMASRRGGLTRALRRG